MLVIGMGMAILGGCSHPTGPEVLTINAGGYSAAFDAALDVTRDRGMPASLRDRRSGIIDTDPCISGSIVEPWRTDNSGISQSLENSIAFQRRRARFEFIPVGLVTPRPDTGSTSQPGFTGPDVVGIDQSQTDLTTSTDDLELRVWVFVERAYTPGLRRSTWTRRETTQSKIITPEGDPPLPDVQYWVPVKRDVAYERRLLGEIQKQLEIRQPDAFLEVPVTPPG
jgi:hypothetical protein